MAANSNNSLISSAAKSIGGKLVKGSLEAKTRMSQIRAMRTTGCGFNLIKTLKKIGRSKELKVIGNIAKKTVLHVALQLAKSNPYTSPLAMGTEAILQSQGVSTTGAKKINYNARINCSKLYSQPISARSKRWVI